MVEIVTGSGIDRILSRNEVQEDTAQAVREARAAAALERRKELAEAAARLRADPLAVGSGGPGGQPANDLDIEPDAPDRAPRIANLISDPGTVNQILQDAQGVDRQPSAGEQALLAVHRDDAFRRSMFISMIDPGRAMTVLGTRELIQMDDDT